MAYIVGLTATDGCLYSKRRRMNFKSNDYALVDTYLRLLGRTNRIKEARTRNGGVVYFTEFHDTALYGWFRSIGLSPRKSLTLGALDVPDAFLMPLVRGLLEGDGSIINKVYRADTGRRSDYFWEYLITSFTSASRDHLAWLHVALRRVAGVEGYLYQASTTSAGNPFFQLRYGKRASLILLPLVYPPSVPCLERKRSIWAAYAVRHAVPLG